LADLDGAGMGFELDGYIVFHEAALTLYDLVFEGGRHLRLSLPDEDHGNGLPHGYWLPTPWLCDHTHARLHVDFAAPRTDAEWSSQLGLPLPLPRGFGFSREEVRLGALLSLAGPPGVMMVSDFSHGGVLGPEHILTLIDGRVVFGAGLDPDHRLEGGAWLDRCELNPTSTGAALLFDAFRGVNLYGADYLPRDGLRGTWNPAAPHEGPRLPRPEGTTLAWRAWFPILARLD
jgi:hypothetical protein